MLQKDDEPDVYVSVPGVVRRQHSIASAGSGSSVGISAGPPPPQQAAGGGGEQPPAAQAGGPSAGAPSLQVQRSLGSGSLQGQRGHSPELLQAQRSLSVGAHPGPLHACNTPAHPFRGLFRSIIAGGGPPPGR
jgi:hypothetical protein